MIQIGIELLGRLSVVFVVSNIENTQKMTNIPTTTIRQTSVSVMDEEDGLVTCGNAVLGGSELRLENNDMKIIGIKKE